MFCSQQGDAGLIEEKGTADRVGPAFSRILLAFAERRLLAALFAVCSVAVMAGSAWAATPFELVYRVSHSLVGDLGSYTCIVELLGNGATEIQAREHIDARMLGIPLYHLDASDTERWLGSRLIAFHAVTDKADGRVEINGEARGDRFVVTSPQGTLATTATVHPAEPCAANFLQSTMVLHPDTGRLEEVRLSGGQPTSLLIAGTPLAVRKYRLDGKTRYTVWVDSRNLPVKFVVDDSTGQATFTLARCVSCDTQISQLGLE
jgi:hypothetical protein